MPANPSIGFGTGPHVTACPPRFTVMPLAPTTSGPVQSPLRFVLVVTMPHGGGATTRSASGREGDGACGKSRHATATRVSARAHRASPRKGILERSVRIVFFLSVIVSVRVRRVFRCVDSHPLLFPACSVPSTLGL